MGKKLSDLLTCKDAKALQGLFHARRVAYAACTQASGMQHPEHVLRTADSSLTAHWLQVVSRSLVERNLMQTVATSRPFNSRGNCGSSKCPGIVRSEVALRQQQSTPGASQGIFPVLTPAHICEVTSFVVKLGKSSSSRHPRSMSSSRSPMRGADVRIRRANLERWNT